MEEGGTEAGGVHPPSSANPADTEDLASAFCVVAAAASTGTGATSRRDHPPQDLRSMVDAPARGLAARRRPQDERLGEGPGGHSTVKELLADARASNSGSAPHAPGGGRRFRDSPPRCGNCCHYSSPCQR